MTTVKKSGKSDQENQSSEAPKATKRVCLADAPSPDRRATDPAFDAMGNPQGMSDRQTAVSNMRMSLQGQKSGARGFNIDIQLKKRKEEEEEEQLTEEEREKRVNERLYRLEETMQGVMNQLEFVKGIRKEWNAQKAGLCNRRLKDPPPFCCKHDAAEDE